MMATSTAINPSALAARLEQAWNSRVPIEPLSETDGLRDPADAYRVQKCWTEKRLSAGEEIVGRKIGLTSAAVQRQMGVDSPDFGTLWGSRRLKTVGGRATAPMARFLQPRAEGELAFLIGEEPPRGEVVTAAEVLDATVAVAPAIEIVDSRIAHWRITLADTIADNASFGAFVLGEWNEDLLATYLPEIEMRLTEDGEEVSAGTGADALGDPAEAVAWLGTTLLSFGVGLRIGDIVLSGAMGPLVPIVAGREYTLEIGAEAPLTVEFTENEGEGKA
jgi:2-keto-4-pentenoate hydratase